MRFDVLTLFPEMFAPVMESSILGRACATGTLEIATHNIRDYADNKHHQADDYPYGGGAGMVMMAQPVFDCMQAVCQDASPRKIMLSPRGQTLTAALAQELARESHLLLMCGHYEGVDERVMPLFDTFISIGDYVLTGGELPAMVLIDCVSRFVPGVLGSELSAHDESFTDGLLEYPQYTRPADFRGQEIPDILLSGHHANIDKWRHEQALELTKKHRPDLYQAFKDKH